MRLEVIRREYNEKETIGELLLNDEHFCWTLEDRVRPPGVKIQDETAIPEGQYKVTLEAFRGDTNKMYPYLHDVPMFTGICMHGGNTDKDTSGCILVGFYKEEHAIYNSAVLPLASKIKTALDIQEEVTILVRNGG